MKGAGPRPERYIVRSKRKRRRLCCLDRLVDVSRRIQIGAPVDVAWQHREAGLCMPSYKWARIEMRSVSSQMLSPSMVDNSAPRRPGQDVDIQHQVSSSSRSHPCQSVSVAKVCIVQKGPRLLGQASSAVGAICVTAFPVTPPPDLDFPNAILSTWNNYNVAVT